MKILNTAHIFRSLFSLSVIIFTSAIGFCQERAQADVSITSVTITDVKVKTPIKPVSEHAPGTLPVPGPDKLSLASSGNLKCSITVRKQSRRICL